MRYSVHVGETKQKTSMIWHGDSIVEARERASHATRVKKPEEADRAYYGPYWEIREAGQVVESSEPAPQPEAKPAA